MHEPVDDTLLEAIGGLPEQDVGSARREGIRSECHRVLRRRSGPIAGRWLAARVLEPALATMLAMFYILGVIERTLLLLAR